ncbi:MAG: exodeoxyribonuclease V subunit gamma [Clostridia bacterium]|nr:exodeoxyribonuclease V subunit gamma [Clostridia bacterium]
MLRLVVGRAGSGKTKYVEQEFTSRVKSGDNGLVLIVPEQFSFECERMFLRNLSAAQARNIDVLSFTRMADRLIDACGYSASFLDKGKQAVAMSIALLSVEDELEVYKNRDGKLDFLNELVVFMGELKHNCVTPEALVEASTLVRGEMLRKKLRDASIILRAYSAVESDIFYDSQDKLDILYNLVLKTGYFKGKTVAIDSFKGFTEQEMRVIGLIAEQADELFITLCCENAVGGNSEFSLFGCVERTAKNLIELAKRCNVKIANPVVLSDSPRFCNEELKTLEQNVFRSTREKFDDECRNVEVCHARDIYEECDWVARRIKKLLREEKMRAREIAVIYRNDDYAQPLADALRRCEIPVFEDARQPLSIQPLLVFIKHLFSVVRSGYNSEEIFKYLKSGLAGVDVEQVATLENYVYTWRISGSDWKKEWTGNPRGYEEESETDKKNLARINSLREKVVSPLKNFSYKCKDGGALEISTAIFELFREIDVRGSLHRFALSLQAQGETVLADEQELAWKFVMQTLDDMVKMLSGKKINLETYARLFEFIVNSSDFGRLPSGLDEVELGNADRIRTVNPRVVFVIGLNDGQFPKASAQGVILSDFERKELSRLGTNLVDDGEYTIAEERFLAYSALCCAREKVYASYSKASVGGEKMSPSEAIAQIKSVFPTLVVKSCAEADEVEYVCCEDSAFGLLAEKWTDNDEMSAVLKKVFSKNEKYAPVLSVLERVSEKREFAFENPEVSRRLFGDNVYISASKAEAFHKCRFAYFCKFGLNVKKRTVAELDLMKSGLAVHYVMEHLLRRYGKDGLISASANEIDCAIDGFMDDYLEEFMAGKQEKTGRFMYLFKRLKVIIKSVVDRTVAEFSQSEFEFVAFELKIARDGEIEPLKLPLSDGGFVSVHGSVDRVDTLSTADGTYVRVVDYKTGTKKFKLSDILKGVNMQMLIYLDCICKNGAHKFADPLPAGVLYMPSKREFDKYSGKDTVVKEVKSRMEGIVIDNLNVLNAMEKGVNGIFLPVRYDEKTGLLKENFISAAHFGKLFTRIEETLVEMGELLHKGNIEAHPLAAKNDTLPCEYCDYKSVCLSDGKSVNELVSMTNDKVFEILDGGENSGGKMD